MSTIFRKRTREDAIHRRGGRNSRAQYPLHYLIATIGTLLILAGCGSCKWNLEVVDYTPVSGRDWQISTPAEQGLDPALIDRLFYDATKVQTLQALLVVKNDYLVAERYFGDGSIDDASRIQSATKSITSAMVGIAVDQGYITSIDQKMIEFFPELAGQITDPRKNEITIREMLQMRAGYPWEESTPELFEMLYHGFRPSLLATVPLATDPGTHCEYSNLTSHLLGVIVARATGVDLKTYAEQNLFDPIGVQIVDWIQDWDGYYNGHADLYIDARDMAKFGLLYLNGGTYNGTQLIPAQWVEDSLVTYSENAWQYRIGRNVKDMGYGFQWWTARAGRHHYAFAWGHGGQQIALVKEHNMVVIVKSDPLWGQHGDAPWRREKENLNLVGNFISTLPVGS